MSTYIGRCTHSLGNWLSEWEQQKEKLQFNSTACLASWCCDIAWVAGGVTWGAGFVQFILTDQHHFPRKFPNQRARVGAGLNYLSEKETLLDTTKYMSRFKQNLVFWMSYHFLGQFGPWAEQVHNQQSRCLSLEDWTIQSCQQEIISI